MRLPLIAVLLAVLLSGCATPAVNEAGYRGKAQHSAQQMLGIIATARYAADLRLKGRLPQSVADTVVSDAENDGQSVLTAFDSRQPPDHAMDVLRTRADQPLSDAGSELTDLRVAVRRQDRAQVNASVVELGKTAKALQQLAGGS